MTLGQMKGVMSRSMVQEPDGDETKASGKKKGAKVKRGLFGKAKSKRGDADGYEA